MIKLDDITMEVLNKLADYEKERQEEEIMKAITLGLQLGFDISYLNNSTDMDTLYKKDKEGNKRLLFITEDSIIDNILLGYNKDNIGFVIVPETEYDEWVIPFRSNDYKDYRINRYGQLVSFKQNEKGKLIKMRYTQNGYLYYELYDNNGLKQQFMVHKVVMESFNKRGSGVNYETINHKNNMPGDNRVSNLEYVSRAENTRKAHEDGLINYKAKVYHNDNTYSEYFKRVDKEEITLLKMSKELGVSYATVLKRNQKRKECL